MRPVISRLAKTFPAQYLDTGLVQCDVNEKGRDEREKVLIFIELNFAE